MYCTPSETHCARKRYWCSSCGELILPGENYTRWRCYDGRDADTVRMHMECFDMHVHDIGSGADWEFVPFSHERPAQQGGEVSDG